MNLGRTSQLITAAASGKGWQRRQRRAKIETRTSQGLRAEARQWSTHDIVTHAALSPYPGSSSSIAASRTRLSATLDAQAQTAENKDWAVQRGLSADGLVRITNCLPHAAHHAGALHFSLAPLVCGSTDRARFGSSAQGSRGTPSLQIRAVPPPLPRH